VFKLMLAYVIENSVRKFRRSLCGVLGHKFEGHPDRKRKCARCGGWK